MVDVQHPSMDMAAVVVFLSVAVAVLVVAVGLLKLKLKHARRKATSWETLWRQEADSYAALRREFDLVHKDYTRLYDRVNGTVNGKPRPPKPTRLSKEEKLRIIAEQTDSPHEAASARAILNDRQKGGAR